MDFSWERVRERCRARLLPMYGCFLMECNSAAVIDGTLFVYAPDCVTVSRLDNERVKAALCEETGANNVEFKVDDNMPPLPDDTPMPPWDIDLEITTDPPPVLQSKSIQDAPAIPESPQEFKPITTIYDGYKFRSRLEARWAVFFHEAGIEYQYETDGFQGENGLYYLPDFYLPEFVVYVEVKGTDKALARDAAKIAGAIRNHATPVSDGLLILGEIPNYEKIRWGNLPVFNFLYCEKADSPRIVGDCAAFVPCEFPDNPDGIGLACKEKEVLTFMFGLLEPKERPLGAIGTKCKWTQDSLISFNEEGLAKIKSCYQKARWARFEHGENGG